jgi:trans-aconitate 2-methyltransferase
VIEGIDSSPEMIAAAADVPRVSFAVGDAADWQPAGDVDVVVSNAALQWIPRHQELMAKWASALPCGGWLAVQVPGNFRFPLACADATLADNARWSPALHTVVPYTDAVGAPESSDNWSRRGHSSDLVVVSCSHGHRGDPGGRRSRH